MANTKKKSTNKSVDKKLDELLKDKKEIENTVDIKKKTTTKRKSNTSKKSPAKKKVATKKTTSKKKTTKKTTPKKKVEEKKFVFVSETEESESTRKFNELSKQIKDLYEKVENKQEIPQEIVEVNNTDIDDDRIDKAYIILNRITIILFIIFTILLLAFIAFVIYICTY
ncbi:MAG: hypothetical protein IK137_01980 [Bacilli bacterium]|nr:hypothetical protein [Bacilli bacterium]